MYEKDPIHQVEKIVKEVHDTAGRVTQPVLKRYPLTFAFLVVFSAAAIIRGCELWFEQITFLDKNPIFLILIGSAVLFLTGMLYKALDKMK